MINLNILKTTKDDKEESVSSRALRDEAAFILRSTRRRGVSGEIILRNYLFKLGKANEIKGNNEFERVVSSLDILNGKNLDGMKVVSDYIARSEPKVENPTETVNNWWND